MKQDLIKWNTSQTFHLFCHHTFPAAGSTDHPLWKVGLKVTPWLGMSGNHSVQYLYTYTVRERGRCPSEKESLVLRDYPEERLVAMFFQDPTLLQFSQDLTQQTKWIPCQDTVIPDLFLWRQAFLSYTRAPVPTAHICCRGSIQSIKTSCKCCIFPKCYSYHTFYKNIYQKVLFYE